MAVGLHGQNGQTALLLVMEDGGHVSECVTILSLSLEGNTVVVMAMKMKNVELYHAQVRST